MDTKTVMVVDDNEDFRSICSLVLANEGYETITFESAKQALQYLTNHPDPGMILVDVNMPDIDGVQFIDTLRADPAHSKLKMVLTSAGGDLAKLAEGRADSYLKKPFDLNDFVQLVSRTVH